jgi:hypothetical protein
MVYSSYTGMLSIPAFEALGSPSHVSFGWDEQGYYIIPGEPGSLLSVKVHKGRHVSLGVISAALAGTAFPIRIELDVADGMLRFGTIEQVEK